MDNLRKSICNNTSCSCW